MFALLYSKFFKDSFMEETFTLFLLLDGWKNMNVALGTIWTAKVTPVFSYIIVICSFSCTVPWTVVVLNGVRSAGSS